MPELPDVEARRRYLQATALHKKIKRVELLAPGMLQGISKKRFVRLLRGRVLDRVERRGKYLIIKLNSPYFLILHLGMTGELRYLKTRKNIPHFSRLIIYFLDERLLSFQNMRKLGKIFLTRYPDKLAPLGRLGPEPLEDKFTFEIFRERIKSHRGKIKPLLLEQSFIAGIGNLYADEVLFQSGIRPARRADSLSEDELERMFKNIKYVLTRANEVNAEVWKLKKFFIPHRGPGRRCFRCQRPLERLRIGGRSSYFCSHCQK